MFSIDFDYKHAYYSPTVTQVVIRVNYEAFHPLTIARSVASIILVGTTAVANVLHKLSSSESCQQVSFNQFIVTF